MFLGLFCFLFFCRRPVRATSLAEGASSPSKRKRMSTTISYGVDLFRSTINACVMLDQANNRFSEDYAPLMDRLLHANCTYNDVNRLNTRVLNGSSGLNADACWESRVITFRNKVCLQQIYAQHDLFRRTVTCCYTNLGNRHRIKCLIFCRKLHLR